MKLTVDGVIFSYINQKLHVLVIKRNFEPFFDRYALPGAFVQEDETTNDAVYRMLKNEANLDVDYLEQLYTFSDINRDPRERIVSVAYYGLINSTKQVLKTTKHATEVKWIEIDNAVKLVKESFDHQAILKYGLSRLKNKFRYEPIGFDLLPQYFTMTELYKLYVEVLGVDLDRRNFNRKILKYGLLNKTKFKTKGNVGKQAKMYEFNKFIYEKLQKKGFNFEV